MAPSRTLGTLWVVATPLGNLEDLSPRAARMLKEVAAIASEDTRRTARLLARFEVSTPTISCHRFNERGRIEPILARLRRGDDIALVSDGGTPAISDPGTLLVSAALEAGLRVSPVPGPCAATAVLCASGLPADRFVFDGFLPARSGERRRRLRELRKEPRTVVVYEAPHRLRECLDDLAVVYGARTIVLARELTKVHETLRRGTAAEIRESLGDEEVRGECALVLSGLSPGDDSAESNDTAESARLRETWERCLREARGDRREALRLAARELGVRRPALWRRLQELGAERA